MPIRFACPKCQRSIQAGNEYAGRKVKCPGCATPLTVPGSPPPSTEAITAPAPVGGYQANAPAPESGGWNDYSPGGYNDVRASGDWRAVREGIRFVRMATLINIWGTIIFMALVVVVFVAAGVVGVNFDAVKDIIDSGSGGGAGAGAGAAAAGGIWILLAGALVIGLGACLTGLVTLVVRMIGLVRCMSVPKESGAAGLAQGTLICEIAEIVLPFLAVGAAQVSPQLGQGMNLISNGLALAGAVLFLLFLRQVAISLDSRQLRERVLNYVYWLIGGIGSVVILLCLGVGAGVAAAVSARGQGGAGGAAALVAIVLIAGLIMLAAVALTLLFKYLALLQTAIDEIDRRAIRANMS